MSIAYRAGRYRCLVTDQAFTTAKTGKPMLVWKIQPLALVEEIIGEDGELHQEESPADAKWERTVRLVINEENEQSLDFAIRKLRYAGFEGKSFDELELKNADILCDCTHAPYPKGSTSMSEQWDLALPQRASKPLEHDGSLTRKLNAIFGKKLNEPATTAPAYQQNAAAASPASKGNGAPPIGDEDIPF